MILKPKELVARTRAKGRVVDLPAVTDRLARFAFCMADRDTEAGTRILELNGQILADDIPALLGAAEAIVASKLRGTMYWTEVTRDVSPAIAAVATLRIRPLLCMYPMPSDELLAESARCTVRITRTPFSFDQVAKSEPAISPPAAARWIRSWRARSGLIPVRS